MKRIVFELILILFGCVAVFGQTTKTNLESLPAQEFPDGNWGVVTNGFQLSLHFEKEVYTNGEMSRGKIVLLVIFVPLLLGLALLFIGPYFFPITYGGQDGTHVFLRFIPIIGGKGYQFFTN